MRLRTGFATLLIGAALMTSPAQTQADLPTCQLLDDFSDPGARGWRSVNDGVMGGRSAGSGRIDGARMIFQGRINTNGGGFASLRRDLAPGQLSEVTHLRFRLQPDARRYRVILRGTQTYFGRSVAYQADIPATPAGGWTEIDIALSDLEPSVFGRAVPAKTFDRSRAQSLGLIIADGVDGPFELQVDWIKACTAAPQLRG